jgi:hypothetical protein
VVERVVERPGALDVLHQASVTACVRVWHEREVEEEMAEFKTTVHGLLALRDWLEALGVMSGRSSWKRPACAGSQCVGDLGGPLQTDAGQGHLNAVANFEFERSFARSVGRDRS